MNGTKRQATCMTVGSDPGLIESSEKSTVPKKNKTTAITKQTDILPTKKRKYMDRNKDLNRWLA